METLQKIKAQSDLMDFFHDFELQVILAEVFYLPVFMQLGNITSPNDICHYGSMSLSQILDRLNQIHGRRPPYLGTKSRNDLLNNSLVTYIDVMELMKPELNKAEFIGQLIESGQPVAVFGAHSSDVFSAAMYLGEEGVHVKFYCTVD